MYAKKCMRANASACVYYIRLLKKAFNTMRNHWNSITFCGKNIEAQQTVKLMVRPFCGCVRACSAQERCISAGFLFGTPKREKCVPNERKYFVLTLHSFIWVFLFFVPLIFRWWKRNADIYFIQKVRTVKSILVRTTCARVRGVVFFRGAL